MTETKDQIFVPRLQALSLYYQQLSKQIIRQYIKKGITAELGEEGHRISFDPAKLKGNYTIGFKYFSQSPEQEIANYSIAAAAAPFLSGDTIRRDILKLRNPDEELSKKRSEMAEELDPSLRLYRYVRSLIEEEKDMEAKILLPTLEALMKTRQLNLGGTQQQKSQGGQMLPLLSEGGGGRRPMASDNLEPNEMEVREEENRENMAAKNRTRREFEGASNA